MKNLKQRLANLESSAPNGTGTHEEFVLWSMEHGADDAAVIAVTDDDIHAFLRGTPNVRGIQHAKP